MFPANSLDDPSLAVPFEGKGLAPTERLVNINAFTGTIGCVKANVTGDMVVEGSIVARGGIRERKVYDYIICGFGTTACVVARKLLDNGNSVLILERGKNTSQRGQVIAAAPAAPETGPTVNIELTADLPWAVIAPPYKMTFSSAGVQRFKINYSEGNQWGGGGPHFYMNAFRGSDYFWNAVDAQAGNTGIWAYNRVKPIMIGMETFTQRPNNPGPLQSDRGTSGPLSMVQNDDWSQVIGDPLLNTIAGAATVGLGFTPDINSSNTNSGPGLSGFNQVGVGFNQRAYELPLRPNFGGAQRSSTLINFMKIGEVIDETGRGIGDFDVLVKSNVLVNRVLFDSSKTAYGVEYIRDFDRYLTKVATTLPLQFPLVGANVNVTDVSAFPTTGRITIAGYYGVAYSGKLSATTFTFSQTQTLPVATICTSNVTGFAQSGTMLVDVTTPATGTANSFGSQLVTYTGVQLSTNAPNTTVASGSNNVALPTGTINVGSTTNYAAAGALLVLSSTGFQLVNYTGVTATTFTGCTGGSGTLVTGAKVVQIALLTSGSNAVALPQATINVGSTDGFPSAGAILVTTAIGAQPVRYTGKTATSFTGCTGGFGIMSTGAQVIQTASVDAASQSILVNSAPNIIDVDDTTGYAASGTLSVATNGGLQTVTYTGKLSASTTIDVASNGAALPTGTITVASTTGFAAAGFISIVSTNGPQRVQYTGVTATTFTGCTLGTGTLATGGLVSQNQFTGCAVLGTTIGNVITGGVVAQINFTGCTGGSGTTTSGNFVSQIQLTGCTSHTGQAGELSVAAEVSIGLSAGAATVISAGSNGLALPQSTINVASAAAFASSGAIHVSTSTGSYRITYTGKTGTSFTGCQMVTDIPIGAGVMSTNGQVTALPAYVDTIRPFSSLLPTDIDVALGRKIILCAGAHASSAILERSGVGDAALLQSLGIDVVVHNPNVGANLASHCNLSGALKGAGSNFSALPTTNSRGAALGFNLHGLPAPYNYPNDATRRIQSSIQILLTTQVGLGQTSLATNMYAPNSRGYSHIVSKNPFAGLNVDLNLLSDDPVTPGQTIASAPQNFPPTNGSDMNKLMSYLKILREIVLQNLDKIDFADPTLRAVALVPTASTTVSAGSNNVVLPTGTINVASTAGFLAAGTIYVQTTIVLPTATVTLTQTVTYSGITATSFTGCSGGVGNMLTGNAVTQGPFTANDAGLRDYVKNNVSVQNHSTGTCRIGSSIANGVVSDHLAVFGVNNLYVSDLSVLPLGSDGNPGETLRVVGLQMAALLGIPSLPAL